MLTASPSIQTSQSGSPSQSTLSYTSRSQFLNALLHFLHSPAARPAKESLGEGPTGTLTPALSPTLERCESTPTLCCIEDHPAWSILELFQFSGLFPVFPHRPLDMSKIDHEQVSEDDLVYEFEDDGRSEECILIEDALHACGALGLLDLSETRSDEGGNLRSPVMGVGAVPLSSRRQFSSTFIEDIKDGPGDWLGIRFSSRAVATSVQRWFDRVWKSSKDLMSDGGNEMLWLAAAGDFDCPPSQDPDFFISQATDAFERAELPGAACPPQTSDAPSDSTRTTPQEFHDYDHRGAEMPDPDHDHYGREPRDPSHSQPRAPAKFSEDPVMTPSLEYHMRYPLNPEKSSFRSRFSMSYKAALSPPTHRRGLDLLINAFKSSSKRLTSSEDHIESAAKEVQKF